MGMPIDVIRIDALGAAALIFAQEVRKVRSLPWFAQAIQHKRAIFRKINEHKPAAHHDALEFPDGRIVLLTLLKEGQHATVLQLFAAPVIDTKTTKRETDAVSLSKTS